MASSEVGAVQPLPSRSLLGLPDELLTSILLLMDIPDLLALSRTCWRLRKAAQDAHLHHLRIWVCLPPLLRCHFIVRPTETDLLARHILLSPLRMAHRVHVAASSLRMSLARNSLRRKLELRPSLNELIRRGVYPATDARVSPVLAQRCKNLEREKIKNMLERELKGRVWTKITTALKSTMRKDDSQESVRVLVARYTKKKLEANVSARSLQSNRSGIFRERREIDAPARAKVHRLRMYFERLSKSQMFSIS
ncbi:hypothetical protein BZA70DRAFT_264738 [Myxozyma melibiosi]|uniref:F-box domain-containing protein n=1 Tax=Myxozyma melibiosi TaxID=54550 RepID=A0ABR1FBY0_9ASCO